MNQPEPPRVLPLEPFEIVVAIPRNGPFRIFSDLNAAQIRRRLEECLESMEALVTPPPPRKRPVHGSHYIPPPLPRSITEDS